MNRAKRLVVVGSLNYDVFLKQQRLPQKGETLICQEASTASGGKGANQAVQAAKMGIETYLIGAVGQDAIGTFLLQTCEKYRVQTLFVQRCDCSSGLGMVQYMSDGSVYATIAEGANSKVTPQVVMKAEKCLSTADAIMLQFEIPVPTVEFVLHYAKQRNIPTLLNAAPAKPEGKKLLKEASCLVLNEQEASIYCGATIHDFDSVRKHMPALRTLNDNRIIVTLGEHGSVLIEPEDVFYLSSSGTANVIETTGAGDSYAGTYMARRLMGDTPLTACQHATHAAEYTISQVGAQNSMPTWREIKGV